MNLLITGAFTYTESQVQALSDLGYDVFFLQHEQDKLPISASEVDAIVCNGLFLYHSIDSFIKLGFIQLTSAGYDRIPLKKIQEKNICLFNARGVYSVPMAEWVLCKVLEYYKSSSFFANNKKLGVWEKKRDIKEICGKNVAIIGAGNIGREIASRFKAFGAYVIGFDILKFNDTCFDDILLMDELDSYLSSQDIIVLALPLTEQTFHLFNYEKMNKMKSESILVNISRGAIIDEKDLIHSLENGKPGYVALDVFEDEPLARSSKLWNMSQVFISPHNSFIGDGNNQRMFSVIYKNLKEYIK